MKPISLSLICAGIVFCFGCSGSRPSNIGLSNDRLAPCPSTPNCVSTQAIDQAHSIQSIIYTGPQSDAMARLVGVVKTMARTKIIHQDSTYLYVEFTSSFWRFVDDVEFWVNDSQKSIQFRSASRLGKSDIGVNRNRMETIRKLFAMQK